jgi:anti-sigma28 factor (negative regulator of flagellin synthesis)
MTLQWIAEKFRRAEKIKEELSQGTYQVDSDKVAKAIIENSHPSHNNQAH